MNKKKPWFAHLAIDQPFMYYQGGGTVGDPIKNLNAMGQATQTNMSSNVVPFGDGTFWNASTPQKFAQVGVSAPYTQVNNPYAGLFDPQPQGTFNPNAPGVPQMMVTPPNPYLNAPQIMEPGYQEDINLEMNISSSDAQKLRELQGEVMPEDRFRTNQVQALKRAPSGDERAKELYYKNMAGRGVGTAIEPEATMPTDRFRTGQVPTMGGMQEPQTGPMAPTDMTNPFDINMDVSDADRQKLADMQKGIAMEETIDGTEVTATGQKGMTVLPSAKPGMLDVGDKGLTAPTTTELAPIGVPTEKEEGLQGALDNKLTGEETGFNADDYYLAKGMIDAGLFARNLAQGPPPTMSMRKPQLERLRMNRQPYEEARQDIREMSAAAMAGGRQNLSQMSDYLKMSQAITTGTQERLAQVGSAEAQQEMQVDMQNQQIANQETMMETDVLNQEMMQNYQIQQEAQRYRDKALSESVAKVTDTMGAYAMYKNQKEQALRQEEVSKKQANLANEMQLNWMKYEAAKSELSSQGYQEAEKQEINKYIKTQGAKLLGDKDMQILVETFGENYDPTDRDKNYKKYAKELANYEYRMEVNKEPERESYDNEEDFLKDQKTWEDFQKWQPKKQEEIEKMKAIVDAEKLYYEKVQQEFDISGQRKAFQSKYLTEAGLPTTAEFIQSVESAIEASRQI